MCIALFEAKYYCPISIHVNRKKPFKSPFNGWKFDPGKFISLASLAASNGRNADFLLVLNPLINFF